MPGTKILERIREIYHDIEFEIYIHSNQSVLDKRL